MDFLSEQLKQQVENALAPISDPILLNGMGSGRAFKVNIDEVPVVIKQSPYETERLFYEQLASSVNELGVKTPRLLASGLTADLHWIALEFIPHQLPKERWRDDKEVVSTVAKIHGLLPEMEFLNRNARKHEWASNRNRAAIQLWPEDQRGWILDFFDQIREIYLSSFERTCLVSGDPNGGNWGLSDDGHLVLFDWERVGIGDPASDLMGIAYGEPEQEIFDRIAEYYLQANPSYPASINELARKVQIARVHISVSIVKDCLENESHIPEWVAGYYRDVFPGWLKKTFTDLKTP